MQVLRIECPAPEYEVWKAAFDRDLLDREGSSVRRYRVLSSTDDPNYVAIDLEFDDAKRAGAILEALRRAVHSLRDASSPIGGGPRTRIAEAVQAKEYRPPTMAHSPGCVDGAFPNLAPMGL